MSAVAGSAASATWWPQSASTRTKRRRSWACGWTTRTRISSVHAYPLSVNARLSRSSSRHIRAASSVVLGDMWANRSDEELLRALPREPGAFSAFYRRHVDDVLGFLARRCRDPEQAA